MLIEKIPRLITIMLFVIITTPAWSSNAASGPAQSNNPATSNSTNITDLIIRLYEIKGMDKSNLSRSEKKALTQEVKSIRKEMRVNNRGIPIYRSHYNHHFIIDTYFIIL